MGLALVGMTALQGSALAEPEPRDVAAGTRLTAQTNPAVQQISMSYVATVAFPEPVPTKAFEALMTKAERHAKAGRIPADHQSQVKWVLRTAAQDVGRYLRPGKAVRKVAASVDSVCTGWWITPDGYMVTGAHCVSTGKAELRQGFADKTLPPVVNGEVRGFLKSVSGLAQPDDGMAKLARKMFTAYERNTMRVLRVRKQLSVTMHDGRGRITAQPLNLVTKGDDWPGEDFALVKMAGARALPTVPLGRDGDVRVGDYVYLSGFPVITLASEALDRRSKLYPSVTEGAYNVRRTSARGVPYLQVQAPAYPGNSGGPVFDKDGRVVGMTIAVATTLDGELTEAATFVLPVSVIKKRLRAAGVTPVVSETSRVYSAALEDYFAGHYEEALDGFRRVRKLYPAHPYVGAFITDAKNARH
ncbi:trypsin-like peptidase domain-containing protein [Nonomuraea sp. NPDC004354]